LRRRWVWLNSYEGLRFERRDRHTDRHGLAPKMLSSLTPKRKSICKVYYRIEWILPLQINEYYMLTDCAPYLTARRILLVKLLSIIPCILLIIVASMAQRSRECSKSFFQ
jgi:hypothetical protein